MLLLVSAYLFPAILLLMPLYLMLSNYRLVGTLPAIVLAHVAITLPLATYLMKSFAESVPRELEEAALVDGCGPFAAFRRVTLPLLRTGLATTLLFSFILSWDEYLFASALSQGSTTTAPVGIQTFISSWRRQCSSSCAGNGHPSVANAAATSPSSSASPSCPCSASPAARSTTPR